MESGRFEELVSRFSSAKVAVLGDFFLDLYIQMERTLSEFSLETHKEAFQSVNLRGQPGAAGVVTSNLTALEAHPAAIGYIGQDGNGFTLRQALESRRVNTEYLLETADRFTPTYIKPMMRELDGQNVELNRMDIINRSLNPDDLNRSLTEILREAIKTNDGVLVVEQVKNDGYGTMSPILRETLANIGQTCPEKIIMVDSRHFAGHYEGVSLKMNLSEAINTINHMELELSQIDENDKISTASYCAKLIWELQQKPVFITLGSEGISGFAEGKSFYFPGFQIKGPIDIVGAGDSVLAGIGLSMCVGATPEEAAYIGNLVGSITVQQLGTTGIATQPDLRQRHSEYQNQIKEQALK